MRRLLASLLVVAMTVGASVSAKKIRTTRHSLTASHQATDSVARAGSVTVCDSAVALHGFDKPLYSLYESVLATNRLDKAVSAVFLTVEYLDRKGRQLHKRSCRIAADIPSGETRLLKFASWDRQHSFYYEKSRRPRVEATRFSVICTVDSVEVY